MFGYYLLTWSMRNRMDFEFFDFFVYLCALCLVFYFSILLLFVRSVWFPFNCILGWGVVFIFSSFHLIWVSLPTGYMHMSGYFRFLGSERSTWGNSSWISILRIPRSFLYGIVQYICYVWVLFFDFIYAVSNLFWFCWFPCFLVRYVFGFFLF